LDLEAEYNNRARVAGNETIIAHWFAEAEAARERWAPRILPYGPGPRECMDLFEGLPGAPWVVFIHGGYWQALGREAFSWVAPTLMDAGLNVAVPSYDLAPSVPMTEIVGQTGRLLSALSAETGGQPVVAGHSAGGHMAAWAVADLQARAGVAISGVFELSPLIHTSLNTALGLDAETAAALSPALRTPPEDAVLDCWVGGDESPEFIRQSRDMAAGWAAGGAQTRFEVLDGLNHFTVLDPLRDPDSALVRRIVDLATAQ
jgi:arylformamidase